MLPTRKSREMNGQEKSNKGCGLVRTHNEEISLKFPRLTHDLIAVVEVHVRQFRAALEGLDVACSLFSEQKVAGKRGRENIPTKKSSGNFIRWFLTLDLLAVIKVQAGHVRAALEHLDVA